MFYSALSSWVPPQHVARAMVESVGMLREDLAVHPIRAPDLPVADHPGLHDRRRARRESPPAAPHSGSSVDESASPRHQPDQGADREPVVDRWPVLAAVPGGVHHFSCTGRALAGLAAVAAGRAGRSRRCHLPQRGLAVLADRSRRSAAEHGECPRHRRQLFRGGPRRRAQLPHRTAVAVGVRGRRAAHLHRGAGVASRVHGARAPVRAC